MKKLLGILIIAIVGGAALWARDLCRVEDKIGGHLPEPGNPNDVIIKDFLDQATEDDQRFGCLRCVGAVEGPDKRPQIYWKIQE